MMISQEYQPGGSYYNSLADQFGTDAADKVAAAARTGDESRLRNALSDARLSAKAGKTISDADYDTRGTASVFFDQVTTDPLAAPAEAANRQLGKALSNLTWKNPLVFIAIAAGLFFYFGGAGKLKQWLKW
jgi:hypothetical protein